MNNGIRAFVPTINQTIDDEALKPFATYPDLLTVQDVADVFSISYSKALRAIQRGQIPCIQFEGNRRYYCPKFKLLEMVGV